MTFLSIPSLNVREYFTFEKLHYHSAVSPKPFINNKGGGALKLNTKWTSSDDILVSNQKVLENIFRQENKANFSNQDSD